MSTYRVSTQSQLKSALNSANGDDTIVLKGGNYGYLSLSGKKYAGTVKITSESSSNQATFSKVSLSNVSNLTFDNVEFQGTMSGGYGTGSGFRVNGSSNVTVQNSDFDGFQKALQAWGDTNLKILNNDFNRISYDGVVVGHTQGVLIQGNEIHMHARGDNHRDAIQFYNEGAKAPSANITVRGNLLTTDDGVTHGIYLGNNDARSGNSGEFYKNVVIEGNTLKTGQMLGVAIGGTTGVSVRNNVVVQTDDFFSRKVVNIPMILVDKDARNVSLSGNTVLKVPVIAEEASNWQVIGTLNNAGSKIVSLGAPVSNASATTASATTASALSATTTETTSALASAGDGDTFRFMGDKVGAGITTTTAADLEHDLVILSNYEAATFGFVGGGNALAVNAAGTYAKLDSLADVRELDQASEAVTAKVSGDTLVLDIAQDQGTHHLQLAGLGQEYQALL